MYYDVKYRERVLEHVKTGKTQKEVREWFGLGANTITQWKKLLEETGKLENREIERENKKIDPEELKRDIAERPDDFDRERAVRFKCTKEAIRKARKKLKITRKKKL